MAQYTLSDVKAAAEKLNIQYRGRKVFRDTANLDYSLEDVADCLCKLVASDYRKSHYYDNAPTDDEYICSYTKTGGDTMYTDKLYIKFCLVGDHLIVDLASFHLPQF